MLDPRTDSYMALEPVWLAVLVSWAHLRNISNKDTYTAFARGISPRSVAAPRLRQPNARASSSVNREAGNGDEDENPDTDERVRTIDGEQVGYAETKFPFLC